MKLLITGGHVTPALAVIDELQKGHHDVQIIFVGRKYTSETEHVDSMEYKEVTKRNVPFFHLVTGRLTRVISFQSFKNLLKVPVGFIGALKILSQHKPDAILSFGGYLALPVAYVGYMMKIPVYTHEQTIHPGLANRIIAKVAKKVFISFEESKQYFKSDVVLTGNPIREQILQIVKKPFEIEKDRPVIYITGGSLGSHSINVHIETILKDLLRKYQVIHQTGNVKEYNDNERLQKLRSSFHPSLQHLYIIKEHVQSDELGYVFSKADVVISRSGANTFFELLTLKKPAIFIPLPWSGYGEQQKQADLFKAWGTGEVFDQERKSAELLDMIDSMIKNLDRYKENFEKLPAHYPKNAAQSIIKAIIK
jgi:UDP-N-acetylglucosamine--N-acetylmuramyl-(pentapeptide) pyrophosphoryl-undecaprenol N-acetylglucosamine transferase